MTSTLHFTYILHSTADRKLLYKKQLISTASSTILQLQFTAVLKHVPSLWTKMTIYHGSSSNVGLRRVWNKATNVADDPTMVARALQSNHYDKSKSQLNTTRNQSCSQCLEFITKLCSLCSCSVSF